MLLWANYNMFFILVTTILSMILFVNTLYFTMSLLSFVIIILFMLLTSSLVSSLTMLIMCIVYVGAIIILIGYICAICPNIMISSYFSSFRYIILASFFFYLYFSSFTFRFNSPLKVSLADYFYSSSGLFVFSIIVLMLFITLLMVTSQYVSPKGPFRSVS